MRTAGRLVARGWLLWLTLTAGAATPRSDTWLARAWQTDEGLPNNSVTGVAQAGDGYLWVATLGGLVRFNGARFEEYSLASLPGGTARAIRRMWLDRRDRCWLALEAGTVACAGAEGVNVYGPPEGLGNSRITSFAEADDGGMWLAADTGFYTIAGEKMVRLGGRQTPPAGDNPAVAADTRGRLWLARGQAAGILQDGEWQPRLNLAAGPVHMCPAHDGSLWISAGEVILKCGADGNIQVRTELPAPAAVTMMFEDDKAVLWIGTVEGLYRRDETGLVPMDAFRGEVLCAGQDREKNLWIGTAGRGLNLLYPKAVHLFGPRTGLPSKSMRSVCQDGDGTLWAAMKTGALMREAGNEWSLVTPADGWPGGEATCVTADPGGGVWIGTADRGLQHWRDGRIRVWSLTDGLGSRFVHGLLAATNGDLWIATRAPDQLVRLRQDRFQVVQPPGGDEVIQALAEGGKGTIWAGTASGRVLRVNGLKMIREPAISEKNPAAVRSLQTTPDGSLWIGYAGLGLGRWWDGHYSRITMKEGLFDDYISQIQADTLGSLWLTGDRGLFQVRQAELLAVTEGQAALVRSIIHGRNEGVNNLQAAFDTSPNSWRMNDGKIWFATSSGLLLVKPDRFPVNTNPPPVVLERVVVDDRVTAVWGGYPALRSGPGTNVVDLRTAGVALALPAEHRRVEFDFAALSFTSPENVTFRYRLKNFDADWMAVTGQHSAEYARLPAGQYEFEVRACNNAGVWNETGCRLALAVPPFFWETWWFRALALAGFTATLVWLVRYFSFLSLQHKLALMKEQAALQKERARIARDIHDEVGAKLSRLSLLSEMAGRQPGLPAAARGDVSEISETTRDTILSFGQIIWAVNPKNDTLTNLANYLCRFAEELFDGSTVQCVFELPDKIPELTVSTETRHNLFLAVKEALNNVLKHAHARQVCIRLTLPGDGFEIAIEDDGEGFATAAPPGRQGNGNGLENMQTRMKAIGGRLTIKSRPGAGTTVVFRTRIHRPAAN